MRVVVQCSSAGQRCGIQTYASRLNEYLNKEPNVSSKIIVEKIRNHPDIININYEPGLVPPQFLQKFLSKYTQPVIITAHHIGYLQQFYPMVDGIVLHSLDQVTPETKPWDYAVIPHPALVFPKKDKMELRKKLKLPEDKKIVGTAGFICGTGKELSMMINPLINALQKDEFLYFITSFWKGGDMGELDRIQSVVNKAGKQDNFRIDTDFVSDEELNEKMQACDLLFAWNTMEHGKHKGSQSGIAPDMYGSRTKLIVKDGPHYSYVASLPSVLKGRSPAGEFVEDVFKALRTEDLMNTGNVPEPISWEILVKKYCEYFKNFTE
ncbi:MAG: hypothetical protein IMZ52_04770 [Actinobacteria bacterium]|nr:hypothetical protein [Actinomycetota bacterium]MBE3114779.1 hypothetical protein [Actinomycetota bacterium]